MSNLTDTQAQPTLQTYDVFVEHTMGGKFIGTVQATSRDIATAYARQLPQFRAHMHSSEWDVYACEQIQPLPPTPAVESDETATSTHILESAIAENLRRMDSIHVELSACPDIVRVVYNNERKRLRNVLQDWRTAGEVAHSDADTSAETRALAAAQEIFAEIQTPPFYVNSGIHSSQLKSELAAIILRHFPSASPVPSSAVAAAGQATEQEPLQPMIQHPRFDYLVAADYPEYDAYVGKGGGLTYEQWRRFYKEPKPAENA